MALLLWKLRKMSTENMELKAENMLHETSPEYSELSLEEVKVMRLFEGERQRSWTCIPHPHSMFTQLISVDRPTTDSSYVGRDSLRNQPTKFECRRLPAGSLGRSHFLRMRFIVCTTHKNTNRIKRKLSCRKISSSTVYAWRQCQSSPSIRFSFNHPFCVLFLSRSDSEFPL